MQFKKKRSRKGKIFFALAAALLGFALIVLYFQFWKKPAEIDSGIARHHLTFAGHSDRLWEVAFSPDGELLASAGVDGEVKIWRKADGQVTHTLRHPAGTTGVKFSPDGSYLLTGSYDGNVRLWRATDGALVRTFPGDSKTVWDIAFSPDGKTIAAAGEGKTVKLWDAAQGTPLRTLEGHSLNIWSVAFSPDGSRLASGSFDNDIKIWNAADGTLIRTLKGHTQAVLSTAFSRDGRFLVSGGDDSTVRLWNAADGSLVRTFQGENEHIYSVAFSPDGKRILSSGRDRNIVGELFQNFFGASDADKWVTVRLWDAADGTLLQTFSHHSNDVFSVAFSPDGQWMASASEDKTVSVWQFSR